MCLLRDHALLTFVWRVRDVAHSCVTACGCVTTGRRYGIMVLRLPSKFDLLRLCRATGAVARATFGPPQPDELGFAKWLSVQVGQRWVCVGVLD